MPLADDDDALHYEIRKKRKNSAAVTLGKQGGKVKSAAKSKAARKNGKLGGRPKSVRGPRNS